MNWFALLENISAFAIASGLLAWLVKQLVKHSLSRDLEAFKAELQKAHAIQMEEAKNRFRIGAMSHMATVAFDKHVQFCEEYANAVNGALLTLLRRGPHQDVLQHAHRLVEIRTHWSLWLSPEVEAQLTQFEGGLRKIGANAGLLGELRGDQDRTEAIKQAYGTFAAVMGWQEWQGEAVTRDLAADRVFEGLRKVLGISELTQLRDDLVKRAVVG